MRIPWLVAFGKLTSTMSNGSMTEIFQSADKRTPSLRSSPVTSRPPKLLRAPSKSSLRKITRMRPFATRSQLPTFGRPNPEESRLLLCAGRNWFHALLLPQRTSGTRGKLLEGSQACVSYCRRAGILQAPRNSLTLPSSAWATPPLRIIAAVGIAAAYANFRKFRLSFILPPQSASGCPFKLTPPI